MEAVRTYAPHQQRVIDEQSELNEKRFKLMQFFDTEIFKGLEIADQVLLRKQADLMTQYSDVLLLRIARF